MAARNHPPIQHPGRRRLRTYAFDPMSTRLSGRYLVLDVPYETACEPGVAPGSGQGLERGPCGELLVVVDFDATRGQWYEPLDLDDGAVLVQDGMRPSESDPRSHQQVVYAVAMSVLERFERFLGRRFRWRGDRRLRLVPHAFEGRNAFFDPDRRAVLFGYYRAEHRDPGPNLPGQVIFTCLSSDIVAHEVTHAIVHRLRRHYAEATNPDVFAWHEACADLVAFFQHFVHHDVVAEAVAATSGDLRGNSGLLDLAREFGESSGRGGALRSAIGTERTPDAFRSAREPHQRGACFVAAVFDAYLDLYQGAIADLLRIATGGTGVLPAGRLHPDLVHRIADEAVEHADRLLGMVVRAFEYLPVVDVTFGDVVRSLVTADRVLYPDDERKLRRTLVEALRRRGIVPQGVLSLADAELSWPRPAGLSLTDPAHPVDLQPLILSATMDLDPIGPAGLMPEDRSAAGAPEDEDSHDDERSFFTTAVGWARAHAHEIGLDPSMPIALEGRHVAYRQAADRQPRPEVVLQFTQRRRDLEDQDLPEKRRPVFRAGTTLIAGVDGSVDFVIPKPFPFVDEAALAALPPGHAAHRHHQEGAVRLAALRTWLDQVQDDDALSAWTLQPAIDRLDFAAMHSGI